MAQYHHTTSNDCNFSCFCLSLVALPCFDVRPKIWQTNKQTNNSLLKLRSTNTGTVGLSWGPFSMSELLQCPQISQTGTLHAHVHVVLYVSIMGTKRMTVCWQNMLQFSAYGYLNKSTQQVNLIHLYRVGRLCVNIATSHPLHTCNGTGKRIWP